MGLHLHLLLLLLTSTLLTCQVAEAQSLFTIKSVTLTLEPRAEVTRGTDVMVRCEAVVSSSSGYGLSREYTIYKDNNVVYTKNTNLTEDLLYPLPQARVANTGKYKCKVSIQGKDSSSHTEKLTVTGLQTPILHLNKGVFTEGDEVMARCTAPEETGTLMFYFFDGSQEIHEDLTHTTDHVVAKLKFTAVGIKKLSCSYAVILLPDSVRSNASNTTTISVKELFITPVITIRPQAKIIEGDTLDLFCSVSGRLRDSSGLKVYLSKGQKLLSTGNATANHTMQAKATDSGEFECILEVGDVTKKASESLTVAELFSSPVLTMYPLEVFEKDKFTLRCKSANYSSEKISAGDVRYSLFRDGYLLTPGSFNGIYVAPGSLSNTGKYTCRAEAKMISKYSDELVVKTKVLVSKPVITAMDRVVVGRSFVVRCLSDRGSLPITYTLWRKYTPLNQSTVAQLQQEALFTITILQQEDLLSYYCDAQNKPNMDPVLSIRLNASVTVPLSNPILSTLPAQTDIAEGNEMYLICSVDGSRPVTFKWYRVGTAQPLFTTTSVSASEDHRVKVVGKQDSGAYYCEAYNYANNVKSQQITVEVKMALWKKGLVVASCLLLVTVLVLACVLRFRAKRGKRDTAAELSVKPSSPKSDDSLTVSLTHDTEVYNAPKGSDESSGTSNESDVEYTEVVHPQPVDPARVPLKKGTDTVYSELQNSPPGADDHHGYGSVEYADLNCDQPEPHHNKPEIDHNQPEFNHDQPGFNHHDLPVPVE